MKVKGNAFSDKKKQTPWPKEYLALVCIYSGAMPENIEEAQRRALVEDVVAYATKKDLFESGLHGKVTRNCSLLGPAWALVSAPLFSVAIPVLSGARGAYDHSVTHSGLLLASPELFEGSDFHVSGLTITL